jgi:hypothetical protein
MSKDNSSNPVVKAAKTVRESAQEEIVLPDGARVKVVPVSAALIDAVMGNIKDPTVPTYYDKDSDRHIPNPGDPNYLREMAEMSRKRTSATIDAFVMFGIDLPYGLPTDEEWLTKLRYLEKLGRINLSEYDLKNEIDLEFLYKRFIVASADIIGMVTKASGVSGEEIAAAEASFRREGSGDAD